MSNANHAFGIDLSRYNTSPDGKIKPDFDIIAAHQPKVVFIGMRAGTSWGYQDPWFAYYFSETQRINRIQLPYHVIYPSQSATAQMDNFFRILGDIDFANVPLVLDLELDHGQSPMIITECTAKSLSIIKQRTGQIPFIYSRANWVNQHLIIDRLPPVHWWLANYRWPWPYPLYTPEHTRPPLLPLGVHTWTIHQTASRGQSIGAKAMHYMDYNRWNGTEEDVFSFLGIKQRQPLQCPIDGQDCCRIFI